MNWRFLGVLPGLAAIAALIVWPIALIQIAPIEGPNAWAAGWGILIGLAGGTALSLWALRPKATWSGLALWVSAGLWAGASYVSTGLLGLPPLIVALITLAAAAVRERERAKASLVGPAGFLAAITAQIAAFNILSR